MIRPGVASHRRKSIEICGNAMMAWESKGKKEKRTQAARAFGKNGLEHRGNIKAIDRDTAEL